MLDRSKLASLIERLEWHMKDSKVNLLIKEAIDTIIEQDKRMADLEATMDAVDGALCNYINGCCDGYEPVSQWDESNKHSFDELCRIYNEWHANNKDVG